METLAGSAPITAPAELPRFSRTAIVGACWAPFLFLTFIAMFFSVQQVVSTARYQGPAWWQIALRFTLLPLGLTAPFGTTILGWIAVSQIRRSAGRLCGLGLAVFDGLLFPLAMLGGFIAWLWHWVFVDVLRASLLAPGTELSAMERMFVVNANGLAALGGSVTALIVSFLIIRAVWRAVNDSPTPKPVGPPLEK